MFELKGSLKFIEIDLNYVKKLYETCNEVYYKPYSYDHKPYLGILINTSGNEYVIPLSSAKEKHKSWDNSYPDRMLIYEISKLSDVSPSSIYVPIKDDCEKVKHIMSVIDFKKMIPIKDGLYNMVNINNDASDTPEQQKYKDLLNKEYRFCLKNIDKIIAKATKIYDYQKNTGTIIKFACDFSALESVCSTY